jgi:hypothetical protein
MGPPGAELRDRTAIAVASSAVVAVAVVLGLLAGGDGLRTGVVLAAYLLIGFYKGAKHSPVDLTVLRR